MDSSEKQIGLETDLRAGRYGFDLKEFGLTHEDLDSAFASPRSRAGDGERGDDEKADIDLKDASMLNNVSYLSYLSRAKTIESLRQRIQRVLKVLGLGEGEYCLGPIGATKDHLGELTTIPKALRHDYIEGGYEEIDLVIGHAKSKTTPVFLSELRKYIEGTPIHSEVFQRNLELCELLGGYGYKDYYHIPLNSYIGEYNMLMSITIRDVEAETFRQIINANRQIIHLVVDNIAFVALTKFPHYFFRECALQKAIGITPKQLRLLTILATDNVGLQGAADKMCISLDTVNKHIAAAKMALGAKTQSTAIYRAIGLGLITVNQVGFD